MIIAVVGASQALDKVGERIDVEGIDITSFEEGEGTSNVEHVDPGEKDQRDPSRALSFGQETVGKVIAAKKVLKKEDCESDLEEEIWSSIKMPYLLLILRLYDAAGHDSAKAQAAQIRDAHANGEMSIVRASIQGQTLDQKGNRLKETVARKVSLTLGPANKTCNTYLIADPQAPPGYDKQPIPFEKLKNLRIFKGWGKTEPFENLYKTLEAGSGMGGPDSLSGGSVLAKEWLEPGARIREALKSYHGKADPKAVKEHLRKVMPELPESVAERLAKEYEPARVMKSVESIFYGLQNVWVELQKGLPDRSIDFGGYYITPGVAVLPEGLFSIVFADQTHYYIVPQGTELTFDRGDLEKIPMAKEGQYFTVTALPAISLKQIYE